ncbi:Uncharacterized protein FKW44_012495 [Caligus rogercresseyi]|uniref:Chorion peroxidase n=2 Tax=Caligus rogercresseyi TaxID=217165 RepID=A0A7T8HJU0_CALRO|nr:Uncharacterized protein FKW44_012495 [Caligus rogercresseyi]
MFTERSSSERKTGECNLPPGYQPMIYQWGMFVAHDISFVPSSIGSKCCSGSTDESCLPIEILKGDPFYSKFNITCLNFYRSVRHCSSEPREQFNDITSFIDVSSVYGSSNDQLLTLKEPDSYLMKASLTNNGKELLPKDCNGTYVAGDARAMLVSGLVSLHTLYVREHNRLARLLAKKYPTMSNHTIFEETRRIVGAINQNIIYGDFLNILLGPESMKKHRLSLQTPSSYSVDVNPTATSSFVSAVFRFGHSMIKKDVSRSAIDEFGVNYTFPLMEDFFNTKNYEDNDGKGMEELIYGLSNSPAQLADRLLSQRPYGSDLEAKTILRGRDHGLPSYGDWRESCGLKPICDWNDRPHEIDPESWSTLKSLYSSPNDIDLHTAGLAENPIPKTVLGPTNNCIIARQFAALKEGDRFFFTHRKEAGSFSEKQIQALRGVTLSRVICDNTDIQFVYEDVFRSDSKILHCSQIPTLNIDLF